MAEESANTTPSAKGLSLFALIGLVVSSCIGSGVFALTGQLAAVAAPGPTIFAWLIAGFGFLMLAMSLSNLGAKRPDIHGIFTYASEGFGPFSGFVSGWGYWLSAWLGNVAFATAMIQALGYFIPGWEKGTAIAGIILVSVFLWALTFLVMRGVESASFLNAIVMVAKVASIGAFIALALFFFKGNIFTADFWGNVYNNAVAMGQVQGEQLGSIPHQIAQCMMVMMWVFIGIEGATVMSSRAAKKSDVGRATVIGLVCLLLIYMGASVLPYGTMSYTEIAQMNSPAMLYVFEKLAPGWGGAFCSIAMVIAIAGAWLSFTMLPAETTQGMAEEGLLPAKFAQLNDKKAPAFSILLVSVCTQIFIFIASAAPDAYDFALSLCTAAIAITWAFAAAYQIKYSVEHKDHKQIIIGVLALAFLIIGTLVSGWRMLLLSCAGYIPGLFVYAVARKKQNKEIFTTKEKIFAAVLTIAGIAGVVLYFVFPA